MSEIMVWLSGLDPVFAFMLALPFAVAVAGLAGEYFRFRERDRTQAAPPQTGHRWPMRYARGGDS